MVKREHPFKGRQFTSEVILWAVRWYLQFPISYRDLELMLRDRGVPVDHTTIYRWIQAYAVELEKRLRPHLRSTNGSWRVDETYIKVKGRWVYLYRQPRPDHRFPAQRQARCSGRQALLQESSGPVEHSQSPHHYGRQERRLSQGSGRDEEGQEALAFLQAAPGQVPQQHRGTRSPANKTVGPTRARLQEVPDRVAHPGWL